MNGNKTLANQAFSLLELFWFLFSISVLINLRRNGGSVFVPLSYALFYLFGFLLGGLWLVENNNIDTLPVWYMSFALIFGLYYVFISAKMLKMRL